MSWWKGFVPYVSLSMVAFLMLERLFGPYPVTSEMMAVVSGGGLGLLFTAGGWIGAVEKQVRDQDSRIASLEQQLVELREH